MFKITSWKRIILKKEFIFVSYQGTQSIHTQSSSDFLKNINEEIHSSYLLSSYYEKIIPEIKLLD